MVRISLISFQDADGTWCLFFDNYCDNMLSSLFPLISLLLGVSSAQNFTTWSPPGPSDVRSPCPGLNSLANHGFLPHNGKGITIPILIQACQDGMNVGADFATVIGGAGILSVPNNPLATSFDLNDLDEHNFPIEHDASLSRGDFYINNGDNYDFNQTIFDTVLAYYNGMNETSIPVASKAKYVLFLLEGMMIADRVRYNRVTTEEGRDPKFTYTPQQFILSYGETALYISVMGDPITGVAPIEYVKIFFGK
jgi:hypothetical protein